MCYLIYYRKNLRRTQVEENDNVKPDETISEEVEVHQEEKKEDPVKKKLSGEKISVFLYNKTRDDIEKEVSDFNDKIEELNKTINDNLVEKDVEEAKNRLADILKNISDPDSYINRLITANEYCGRYTDNIEYMTNVINGFIKGANKFEEAVGKFNLSLNSIPNKETSKNPGELKPKVLSGKEGEISLISRFRGLCKIPLFNSGFWIVVKNPRLGELNEFFETVSFEEDQYGKLLGGHYYLTYDYFLKEKAIEIIHANIVDSSLKDFDKIATFQKAFDLNDYDVALNGICYLMNKDGIDMDIPCLNEECSNTESVCIDLSSIRYNNYDLLTEKNISMMMESKSKSLTLNDIADYKKSFNIEYKIFGDNSSAVITCTTPSIGRHIETGKRITTRLMNGIHSDKITDKRFATKLNSLTVFSYTPWIESIDFFPYTDEWTTTSDPNLIESMVEDLILKGDPILQKIQDEFITKIKVSVLCYPGVQCPKCGMTPSDIKSEFFPADMQSVFFFQTSNALAKPGKNLSRI